MNLRMKQLYNWDVAELVSLLNLRAQISIMYSIHKSLLSFVFNRGFSLYIPSKIHIPYHTHTQNILQRNNKIMIMVNDKTRKNPSTNQHDPFMIIPHKTAAQHLIMTYCSLLHNVFTSTFKFTLKQTFQMQQPLTFTLSSYFWSLTHNTHKLCDIYNLNSNASTKVLQK